MTEPRGAGAGAGKGGWEGIGGVCFAMVLALGWALGIIGPKPGGLKRSADLGKLFPFPLDLEMGMALRSGFSSALEELPLGV